MNSTKEQHRVLVEAAHYHADLQPAVGGSEEERGDVVGVGELQ